MEDVLALYEPSGTRPGVVCRRKEPDSSARPHTTVLPLRPGQVERGTHDYKRNGTTSLLAALELKTNQVIGQLHRSVEFRKFLDVIESQVPAGLDVHLIVDNYATHKPAIIRKWFAKRPRFHVHFTPTYGSWINCIRQTNPGLRRWRLSSEPG